MAARRPPGGASTFDLFSWSDGPPSHPPPPTSAEDAGLIASDLLRVSLSSSDHQSVASFVAVGDDPSASSSPVGRPTIRMHQVFIRDLLLFLLLPPSLSLPVSLSVFYIVVTLSQKFL